MATVLLILHLMIAAALVAVVLLQRSEGGALGIGGGGGFMAGRGGTNLLTRVTASLAVAFFTTSMLLTVLAVRPQTPRSIFDTPAPASAPAKSEPATPAPQAQPGQQPAPAAPGAVPGRGGILDKLQPSAPAGPRVPQSQ